MQNFLEKIENLKKIGLFALKMMGIMLFPAKNMPFPAKYAISGPIRSIWPFSGSIE
jgi:hypothetical protein